MRKYTVADVFAVIDILATIDVAGIKNVFTAASGGGKDNKDAEVGAADDALGVELVLYVLNTMYAKCKDRLIDWFASLQGMERADFLNAPPELVIDTIDEIATGTDSKDFFSRVSALYKKKNSSGTITPKK